ncbi:tol-pal system-associated acyl-CoA thioesterase [Pseudoxanthomonas mexicana]|uniref:tol-pal system-associated acyl-CoA thioesterase n=1 Tax=Pseudoxanthomonas mexicana TaxID=128785 RepID=UPI00398B73A8
MTSHSPLPIPDSRLFSIPTRIYWEDTDAGGVVYHAQYLAFLERARTEWLRARGLGQEVLRHQHDLVFAVRSMTLDFLRPARLDDLLRVTAEVRECRHASVVFAQSIERGDQTLLTAEVKVAVLAAATFRPRRLPETLYQAFRTLERPTDRQEDREPRNDG